MPMIVSAKGRRFMDMYARGAQFRQAIPNIERAAAAVATDVSRGVFLSRLGHRPYAPVRFGRPTTQGRFASQIRWQRTQTPGVGLDMRLLPPYALIQEIGTGQKAAILYPPGEARTFSVQAQSGRAISANLFWASRAGGTAVGAHSGPDSDQLFYASELNIGSPGGLVRGRRKKRIRKEIKGKHFIQEGGRVGFLELKTRLTDEARRIFR